MKIEGFDDDQIAAIAEMWNLGQPIDVGRFLERNDIPEATKNKIRAAGCMFDSQSNAEAAEAYRRMQAQILAEVAGLDKERWNPLREAPKRTKPRD